MIHPDDLPRFRELGVVANAQPLWAVNEGADANLTIPFLGPERSAWQYPFGSLVRSGATLAMGSDWAVSSPDPLWEMHVAVHRTAPRLRVRAADRRAVPARRAHRPTDGVGRVHDQLGLREPPRPLTGSIEVGKRADLAVLDRDLFAHPAEEIADASVMLTFVDGERVYDAKEPA